MRYRSEPLYCSDEGIESGLQLGIFSLSATIATRTHFTPCFRFRGMWVTCFDLLPADRFILLFPLSVKYTSLSRQHAA
jgi:hypothetical protein